MQSTWIAKYNTVLCLKCALIIAETLPCARDLLSPAQTDVLSMRCNGIFHGASSFFSWSFSMYVPPQSIFFFYIYFLAFFLYLNALASPISNSFPLENIWRTSEKNVTFGWCENVKKKMFLDLSGVILNSSWDLGDLETIRELLYPVFGYIENTLHIII